MLAAGDDQHLVGADLGVAAGPDHQGDKDENQDADYSQDDDAGALADCAMGRRVFIGFRDWG